MFTSWISRSKTSGSSPKTEVEESSDKPEISAIASAALQPAETSGSGGVARSFSWIGSWTGSLFGAASSTPSDVASEPRGVSEEKEAEEELGSEKNVVETIASDEREDDFLLIMLGDETYEGPTASQEPEKISPSWQERLDQAPSFVQTGVRFVGSAALIAALPLAFAAIPICHVLDERALWEAFVEYLAVECLLMQEEIAKILGYVKKDPSIRQDLTQRNFPEAHQKAKKAEALEQLQSHLKQAGLTAQSVEDCLSWAKTSPQFEQAIVLDDREDAFKYIAAKTEALEQLESYLKENSFTDLEVKQWLGWAKTDPWFEYAVDPDNRSNAFALIAEGIKKEQVEKDLFEQKEKKVSEQMNDQLKDFCSIYQQQVLKQIKMSWFKQELAKKDADEELSDLVVKTISETGRSFIRREVFKKRNEEEMLFFAPQHPVRLAFDVLSANAEFNKLVSEGKWNSAAVLVGRVAAVIGEKQATVKKTSSFVEELGWYVDGREASFEEEEQFIAIPQPSRVIIDPVNLIEDYKK